MLITAKLTGVCGVLEQMASFQKSTKMPGGDDFIYRFWNTEAARLGFPVETFLEKCPLVAEKYQSTMESLGADL